MKHLLLAMTALTLVAAAPLAGAQATPMPLVHGQKEPAAPPPDPAVKAALAAGKGLRAYFVDVEGGQATLFVGPTGQSLLIDAGWPGDRDADRIVKAAHDAGLTKIDTVLITHYHTDHVGGVPALASKIAIGKFLDHGPNTEMDHGITEKGYALYQQVLAEKNIPHESVKAGELLNVLPGVSTTVISSAGKFFPGTFIAAKMNYYCAKSPEKPLENSENDESAGLLLVFGRTRILDLGDLTWGQERRLMCPLDRLGRVDVYVVSHHGFDRSSSPALIYQIAPRLAIMDNGGHKGADAGAWSILANSERMKKGENLWQLHTAEAGGAHNVDDSRIANLTSKPDPGYGLLLTVAPDGDMTVRNDRTGQTVSYPAPATAAQPHSGPAGGTAAAK